MYAANYTANQYRVNSVNTSQEQLVVMCYDGMIRFLTIAEQGIQEGDVQKKIKHVNKVLAIIEELQSTLDFQRGGEIAVNLDRLYNYFSSQLMRVSLDNDLKVLNHIKAMFQDLRISWAKVAAEQSAQVTSSGNLALSG